MQKINLEQLGRYLDARSDVIGAVVFGSAKDGMVREGGDLDLGVYFSRRLKSEEKIEFLVEVAAAAEFDVVDLVDLASADPILAFEALSGRFVSRSSPSQIAELAARVSREYEETMARLSAAA